MKKIKIRNTNATMLLEIKPPSYNKTPRLEMGEKIQKNKTPQKRLAKKIKKIRAFGDFLYFFKGIFVFCAKRAKNLECF